MDVFRIERLIQVSHHVLQWKEFSGAFRRPDIFVSDDVRTCNPVVLRQRAYQAFDRQELLLSGPLFLKITDQNDADSLLVVFRIGSTGVRPVELFPPPKRRFDLPVRHSLAVADHKVISDPQPGMTGTILPLQMGLVD